MSYIFGHYIVLRSYSISLKSSAVSPDRDSFQYDAKLGVMEGITKIAVEST